MLKSQCEDREWAFRVYLVEVRCRDFAAGLLCDFWPVLVCFLE